MDESVATYLKDDEDLSSHSISLTGARQRFLVNVASNFGMVMTQTLASLWLTPFLILHLGIAGFGIIPLASSIVNYMSILTSALNSAVSRFLTIDMEKRDSLSANKTFNTSLFGVVGLILLMTPIAVMISLLFPTLFNVPPLWKTDAILLSAMISASFFVTALISIFSISTFIHSQFLLGNITNFLGLLARIGFILVFFSLFSNQLWYAGGGAFLGALVTFVGSIYLWRKLTPELRIEIRAFDTSRLRLLGTLGWWTIVTTLGVMILDSGSLIILNIFLGAAIAGGYASVLQLSLLMEYIINAADVTIRPIILIKYAQRDFVGLKQITSQVIKLLGWALALPVGILCGFARPLLSLWLGPTYVYLDILLIIIISHLSLNLCVRPLLRIQTAYNEVRWPGIATIITGLVFLVLAVFLAKYSPWGATGVALAGTIAWTARNAVYMPIYTAHIMKLRWLAFFPSMIASIIGTFFVGILSYIVAVVYTPTGWVELGLSAVLVSLVYALLVWTIGINRADRQLAISLLPTGRLKTRELQN